MNHVMDVINLLFNRESYLIKFIGKSLIIITPLVILKYILILKFDELVIYIQIYT